MQNRYLSSPRCILSELGTVPQTNEAQPPPSSSLPKVYGIPIEPAALAHYSRELQLTEPAFALSDLAAAIASSPIWAEMPSSVLIARPTPQPALAVLGCLDEAAMVHVRTQLSQLNLEIARLRYVSYHQAELDCQRLAALLVDRFGREELQRFHFSAIPRGGLIVLGLLAYALSLTPEQLQPPQSADVPWVVVDDCVYTGSRLHHFLQCHSHQKVVFAHLYSHPELRAKLEASEPRVLACLSAHDNYDYAPGDLGDSYSTWFEHSLAQLSGNRYWVGRTNHVCFAWNEPDRFLWNPVTERIEGCWLLLSKAVCLKNQFKATAQPTNVQVQPEATGPLKPTAQVVFGKYKEQLVIGNLATQESFGLSDLSADIWLAIVEHGNQEEVIAVLLQNYDIDEATLRTDVGTLINELCDRGLLI